MKHLRQVLQAGSDIDLHFIFEVGGEPVDLEEGDDLKIALYTINRRCLFSASLSGGGIEKEEDVTGGYVCHLGFDDTVNMPGKTVMEIVEVKADGSVRHSDDDLMMTWKNNTINDMLR